MTAKTTTIEGTGSTVADDGVVTVTATLLDVRRLLARIEERLDAADVDASIDCATPADACLLAVGSLVRLAAGLLSDAPGAIVPKRRCPRFGVGARFWSEGLQAPCRVLAIHEDRLEFESESVTEQNIRTDVSLELVARHVTAGRWRVLSDHPERRGVLCVGER